MRIIGTYPQPFNYEVTIEGMLDARMLVSSYEDLLLFTELNYLPNGFIVSVIDSDPTLSGLYKLEDNSDLSNPESWTRLLDERYANTLYPRLDTAYANPSWISSIHWDKVTHTPTTIGDYGITDFNILGDVRYARLETANILAGINTFTLSPQVPAGTSGIDAVNFTQLAQETTNRTNADTTLQSNIVSEAAFRAAADTTLQTNINNEASTRSSADTVLQSNITAEESTRITADITLQTEINSINSVIISQFTTIYGSDAAWTDSSTYVNTNLAGKVYQITVIGNTVNGGSSYPFKGILRQDGTSPEVVINPSGGFALQSGYAAQTGDEFLISGVGVIPADIASQASLDAVKGTVIDYFQDVITGDAPTIGTGGNTFTQVRGNDIPFPYAGKAKLFEAYAVVAGTGKIKFYSVSGTLWTKVAESQTITVPGVAGLFSVVLNVQIQAGWVCGWYSTDAAQLGCVSTGGRRSSVPTNGEGSGITTVSPTSHPLMRITVETVQKVKTDINALQAQITTINTGQTTQDTAIALNASTIAASAGVNYWPYQNNDFSNTDYVDNNFNTSNYARDWIAIGNTSAIRLIYISTSNIKRRIRIDNITDFATGDIAYLTLEILATKISSSNGGVKLMWTDDSNTVLAQEASLSRPSIANVFTRVRTPGIARPAGATRLWMWVEFNTVVSGDYAYYWKVAITKNFAVPANAATSIKDIASGVKAIGVLTSSIIYMSPDGLDTNTGSILQPVLTLSKALILLKNSGRVHLLRGTTGIYLDTTVNNITPFPEIVITCDEGVIVKCGTQIVSSWAKTGGYNYIYETAFTFSQTDSNIHKVYEETLNPASLITKDMWYHQMRSNVYTVPFWVINRVESVPDTTGNYHNTTNLNNALAEMDASPLGKPLFYYDYVNSKIYLVCSDRGDPTTKIIMKPSQGKYYMQSTNSADYSPGKVSIYNLEVWYAGLGDMKCEAEFHTTTVCGSFMDGYYPSGKFRGYGISARACGNDGFSPHATQNYGVLGRFSDILVENGWFEANWDEGASGHYWNNRDRYVNCLARYSEHGGGFTPAYGSRTELIDCISIGNGVYGGGGGITVLGFSGDKTYCKAIRHISINENIGLDDRSISGMLEAYNCSIINPTTQAYKNVYVAQDCRTSLGAVVGTITNQITTVAI